MKLIHVTTQQVTEAGQLFQKLIESMCDLPHAVCACYDLIPQLQECLLLIVGKDVVQNICTHLHVHVQYYIQYVTYPDHYTLVSWSHTTKQFLDTHEFDRNFCDLWRAHVHLLMLHAQANWARKWDQEQSCWFKHNDVCDLLKAQFETWLQQKCFDQAVTLN
jgi:hypothetical protein